MTVSTTLTTVTKKIKHTLVTTGRGLMGLVGEEQCTIELAWLRMFENVYNVG